MDMVSKMKPLSQSPLGSRVASVHNGSSLFTGDAGSGESNIRRYIIENDWLEAIIQLPQNMFYNTGISTYIWVLSNNKAPGRKGKVQLIDGSELYQKLRKNLGEKNCEFAPEHIEKITHLYLDLVDQPTLPPNEDGEQPPRPISKVFRNRDFGFYKVTIERPLRFSAQFTPERVATLRYVPALAEVMEWAYGKWGDDIYTDLADHKQAIEDHLEKEEITLTPKNRKALFTAKTWTAQLELMQVAEQLMEAVGQEEWNNFNTFSEAVTDALKELDLKLSASEQRQLFNAVTWRDESAARVVKKAHKLKGEKLEELLTSLGTTEEHLPDFGYWPSEKAGVWIEYDTDSELRDTESIPLNYGRAPEVATPIERGTPQIHDYFLQEVRPHGADAWIALDKTQIGYEINFNKYFYQHKPLRKLETVVEEILALEEKTEGLLKRLVSFGEGEG
jgi:type I restriction enzyme M protein